jgi:hypothetical protein
MDIGVFSVADLLMFAKLSSAAYMIDDKAAVAALGMHWVGQVATAQCQATVCTWGGYAITALRGTQVTTNLSIPELFDDIDNDVLSLAGGARVHRGFWLPLAELWPQIDAIMPPGQPLVVGHSLGGVRAHLTKSILPEAEVVSFGAPKGADDAFWSAAYGSPPLRVVHEADFAPGFPYDGPWTQPADLTWLHAGAVHLVPKRPGWCISAEDHYIDTGYIPAIEALPNLI